MSNLTSKIIFFWYYWIRTQCWISLGHLFSLLKKKTLKIAESDLFCQSRIFPSLLYTEFSLWCLLWGQYVNRSKINRTSVILLTCEVMVCDCSTKALWYCIRQMVVTTYHSVPLFTIYQHNILGRVGDLVVAAEEQVIRMIDSSKKEWSYFNYSEVLFSILNKAVLIELN